MLMINSYIEVCFETETEFLEAGTETLVSAKERIEASFDSEAR